MLQYLRCPLYQSLSLTECCKSLRENSGGGCGLGSQPASVDIFLITLTNVGLWPRTSGGEEGSDADSDRIYICSEDLSKKSGRALNFVAKILKTT